MKRRNADCGIKIRRPIKRNKITESMHSNTFLYMKFLILWAIVIIADFMLEFRFEFIWPFWLLLRSVHDSFKYKGLAFSVLFVCIAITSDLICLFFIPVHWLFFAASTYVWVQYVWHTDKGICLPTIILWMLFVYLEAFIRWKDSRHMPHLDLCRPFAAHCIGYPVVSLGFGFKSYVGHLMRIRKQREVAKENEFYMQLLQQALPQLPTADEQTLCLPEDEHNGKDNTVHIQTLNGDISCGGGGPVNSRNQTSSMVGGLGALTGELIKDLIATTTSLMSGATQHITERAFRSSSGNSNNHNAQTTTNSSSSNSSSNKVLSLGGAGGGSNTASGTSNGSPSSSTAAASVLTGNGHAVSVQNHSGSNGSAMAALATGSSSSSSGNLPGSSSKDRSNSSVQCSNSNAASSGGSSVVGNGAVTGLRKQSHNGGGGGGGSATDANKQPFDYNNGLGGTITAANHYNSQSSTSKGSYHATGPSPATAASAASSILSTALFLSTATGSSAVDKQIASSGGGREKDYALMNGNGNGGGNGAASSGGGKGGEYHQQSKENNRLASNNNNNTQSSGAQHQSHMNGTGMQHYNAQTGGGGGGDSCSTNHITSASSSPLSSSSESTVVSGGKLQRMNGHVGHAMDSGTTTATTTAAVENGGGIVVAVEKTKGKKNRSKQKQDTSVEQQMVQICTSCSRLEMEVKRMKSEVSHTKQVENELKQRTDTNANLKTNVQAKNKEIDELEKKIHELTTMKQNDRQMLNSLEQRLGYEQRQRKQMETLLVNERKMRGKAEEKTAKCFSEMASIDEKKKAAELQSRSYEVEMRKMENELRNRESEEVLLGALQSMQEKNMSLEKSLSCETRFKLDLFSALGEARRQIELKDGLITKQKEEISDLMAKIAQLVAIMPIMPISPSRPDSGVGVGYHHGSSPSTPAVSSSCSMLRLSNGSPLMVNANQDMNNNANERSMKMMGQSPPQQQNMFIQQQQQHQLSQQQQQQAQQQQQQQQQQQGGLQSSTLDPNARAYTPVNTEAA